jgi:hypothetical protein
MKNRNEWAVPSDERLAFSSQLSAFSSQLADRICPPTPLSSVIMANESGFVESLFWPREE